MKKAKLLPLIGLGLLLSGQALAELSPVQQQIKQAMQADYRPQADIARDENRDPINAVAFWGLKPDMKVIEFAPGNGWYTKLLAPVLKQKGELYLAYKDEWLKGFDKLLAHKPLSKAKKLPIQLDWDGENKRYTLGELDFGVKDADMMLNIREYHNFSAEDKAKLNKATFDALKPGGKYVIVDHSRRPMSPETFELRRREDPVKVILEVQAAGFKLLDSSDMFYKPDDELIYEVGRKTVTGNTDRFSLVFVKP